MTVMDAPTRTVEQRFAALALANEVRVKRSRLKADIKSGERSLVDVLADPPEFALTAKVWDFLMAAPGVGPTRINRWLSRSAISPSKTLGGLTVRQRGELIKWLRS